MASKKKIRHPETEFYLGLPLEAFHHYDLGLLFYGSPDSLGIKMAWDKTMT